MSYNFNGYTDSESDSDYNDFIEWQKSNIVEYKNDNDVETSEQTNDNDVKTSEQTNDNNVKTSEQTNINKKQNGRKRKNDNV